MEEIVRILKEGIVMAHEGVTENSRNLQTLVAINRDQNAKIVQLTEDVANLKSAVRGLEG